MLLNGRARKTVRGISITKLMKGNGVEEIIKILDEIFQIEEAARAYHAFKDYVEHRAEIRDFSFLVEYEKRYRETKCYKFDYQLG